MSYHPLPSRPLWRRPPPHKFPSWDHPIFGAAAAFYHLYKNRMPPKSRSRSRSRTRKLANYKEWARTDPRRIRLNTGIKGFGNIVLNDEEARMTSAERAAKKNWEAAYLARLENLRKHSNEEEKVQRAREHMLKKTARFVNPRTGKIDPAKRIFSVCKKAFEPAADGFPAGCFAHSEERCPWFHPGEPGYDAVCSGAAAGPSRETSAAHARRGRNTTTTRKVKK